MNIIITTVVATVVLVVLNSIVKAILGQRRRRQNRQRAEKYFQERKKEQRKAERTACEEIMNKSFRTMISIGILLTMTMMTNNIATQHRFNYNDAVELENTVKVFHDNSTVYALARAEYYKLSK